MSDFDLIGGRDATRADVIAAIEADEELRLTVAAAIMTHAADALELRARRALDEWHRGKGII